jgi:NADPH-dependent 2,4-dienoyl-CoA reductase/sulfur reductase-like enzyme
VLLVGGGVAAVRCARTLRRHGFTGSMLLAGDEERLPYNRPPLSKELLRDDLPDDLVLAEPATWYERQRVEVLLGAAVVAIDASGREAALADGRLIAFGKCLLATGAEPMRLPIPWADEALLLRTVDDARRIRDEATAGRRAIVIGGGFIGVEAAASLAARGLAVTVLELGPLLWRGSLGPSVSAWAVERLDAAGVAVRLDAAATAIGPGSVAVGDEELPADLVVLGVGVRPRTALAEAAGLAIDDGVLVGDGQETSVPGIFAAGDVARPAPDPRVEHWHSARESGERAALGMLGAPLPPRRAPWVYSEFGDAKLDVFGVATSWDREVVRDGLHAFVRAGVVESLVVLDGAVDPELARAFVERRPPPEELARLAVAT